MPEVACPNPFGIEAFNELAKDGFDAVTHIGQITRPRLFLVFGGFVGSQQLQAICLAVRRLKDGNAWVLVPGLETPNFLPVTLHYIPIIK